jgi:competence protein ComEC
MLAPAAPVHVMFAPHHGSLSSSSMALVRVLDPHLALVNAARGNRFGHPHPRVVARYRRVGARLFQTGREGALIWRSSSPQRLIRWRRDRSPYWRGRDVIQAAPP